VARAREPESTAGEIAQLVAGKEFRGFDLRDGQVELSRRGRYLGDGWVGADSGRRFTMKRADDDVSGKERESIPRYAFHFSDDDKVAAVAVDVVAQQNDSYRFPDLRQSGWMRAAAKAGLRPTDCLGWSSSFGCVYTTQIPELLLAIEPKYEYVTGWGQPKPYWKSAIVVLRFFGDGLTDANVHREWTPWASIAPAIAAAQAKGDTLAVVETLGDRPVPLLGAVVDVYEWTVAASETGDYRRLTEQAAAASGWKARVEMLRRIRRHWRATLDYNDAHNLVEPALQRAFDLSRRKALLARAAEAVLPAPSEGMEAYRLVRTVAIQLIFDPDPRTADPTSAWIDKYAPFVANLADQSKGRLDFTEVEGYAHTPALRLGARWRNTPPGANETMRLEFGPLDTSSVASQRYEERTRTGGWVPATAEQIAEQERLDRERSVIDAVPARIAAIERELELLDTTPLGTEVEGAAGDARQESWVDAQGIRHIVQYAPSAKNRYRVGVGRDALERAARRGELNAERERLKGMQGVTPPERKVIAGKVWSRGGGDVVVTPGYMFDGVLRRELKLVGEHFTVRIEQTGICHEFRETANEDTTREVIALTAKYMDSPYLWGLTERFGELVRAATAKAVEREALAAGSPVDLLDAEMVWVRALLALGDWPSNEVRDYLFEKNDEREKRDAAVSM